MASSSLSFCVKVDRDKSIYEMFDVAESLAELVDMVPDYRHDEAEACKEAIVNKMLDWIDAEEKE